MIINKLYPQGFCKGVNNAVLLVKEALNNPLTKKPIYILGSIIHNSFVVKELNELGAITLDDKSKTKKELLDSISEGTVIFSAHGVSPDIYDLAYKKGLDVIDATCKDVLKIHNQVKKYLNLNYEIFYIGTKNHAETLGVLGIDNKINLITCISDIPNIDVSSNIYVCNQTTLSHNEIKNIYDVLNNKYKNIITDDQICDATTLRQKAVLEQPNCDLCIIVGDKASSNSKKLYSLSFDICKLNSILIDSVKDLYNYDFTNISTINITSGASTPFFLTKEIINYLNNLK